MNTTLRNARIEDAPALVELMNMAGDGIPAYLWGLMAAPGEEAVSVGRRRVAGTEGGFSHTNAHVVESDGVVAGMLLGYRLPDPGESHADGVPAVVRPLLELESLAPGSWYINAVATAPGHRGRGVGSQLMAWAERLAQASDARSLSLIVAEANAGACRLYARLGYQVAARRPIVAFPGCPHAGDWLLMVKVLSSG
ncbi:MAG: N-acetyltransferase family protein [Lysobacteraceae bacterium]